MSNPLIFFLRNTAIGFGLAAFFVAACLYFDVGRLHSLILQDDLGGWATLVLWITTGAVFAVIQIAWAVFSLSRD